MSETVPQESPQQEPMSRIQRKREERVDLILRNASQVLAEHGYHNTSLEMIAERLDLTKASLYHYYGSKDELVQACLTRVARLTIDQMATIVSEPGSPTERLRRLIVEQLKISARYEPEMSRLFVQQFDWPESMSEIVRGYRAEHTGLFERALNAGVDSGEFAAEDSDIALHCMFGALNLFPVWFRPSSKSRDNQVIEATADQVMKLFTPS
jgi:AcrR family transcriptional regulator